MAKFQKNVDLLQGKPSKALIKLSLPIILASYLQILYNITDMYWISSLGANSIAAVGTGGNFIWLATGIMIFSRMGGQVMAGRAFGSQNREDAMRVSSAAIKSGLISSLLVMAVYLGFNQSLIGFFHFNHPETVAFAELYLKVVALGLPAIFLTGIISGLLAAGGNTKNYLIATLFGLILNIILDPVLIFGAGLKVLGAAMATVISQFVALFILCIGAVRQQFFQKMNFFERIPSEYYFQILKIGVPSGLQSLFYAGITIVLGRFVAEFGDLQVAVQRVGSQLESITYAVADSLAIAVNAFHAQNLAAKNINRLKQGYQFSFGLSILIGMIGMILFMVFPQQIGRLFFTQASEIEAAKAYLVILGVSQIFMCIEIMIVGSFAGLGNTFYPSLIVTLLTLLRIPAAYLLAHHGLGINGIWYAISMSSVLKGLVLSVYYHCYQKQLFRTLA